MLLWVKAKDADELIGERWKGHEAEDRLEIHIEKRGEREIEETGREGNRGVDRKENKHNQQNLWWTWKNWRRVEDDDRRACKRWRNRRREQMQENHLQNEWLAARWIGHETRYVVGINRNLAWMHRWLLGRAVRSSLQICLHQQILR